MSEDFHLIHLRPKLDRLLPWAQRQGLIPDRGQGDLGYAFHAVLRAAFADLAPQPFSFRSGQGLLAYTKQAEAIRLAVAMTTPEVADMLGLDATVTRIAHSPIPHQLEGRAIVVVRGTRAACGAQRRQRTGRIFVGGATHARCGVVA